MIPLQPPNTSSLPAVPLKDWPVLRLGFRPFYLGAACGASVVAGCAAGAASARGQGQGVVHGPYLCVMCYLGAMEISIFTFYALVTLAAMGLIQAAVILFFTDRKTDTANDSPFNRPTAPDGFRWVLMTEAEAQARENA